jgi:peptidoglycan/xylan/chitin deacetylase (PgdA/CDA1 family)
MLSHLLRALSPAGARGRLSILILHRVLPAVDPLFPDEVDAARFDRMCRWLTQWFNVLPLDEAVHRLSSGTLPARALSITFDDGYADNHEVALPILQKHRLPATFYIATGFLDGGRMWNDTVIESVRRSPLDRLPLDGTEVASLGALPLHEVASRSAAIHKLLEAIKYLPGDRRLQCVGEIAERSRSALPVDLMMRSDHVRGLRRAGMQIGAHTVSHPILAKLTRDAAREEIAASKQALESLLGESVELFAYPNGKPGVDYTDESVDVVRGLGFSSAVSTAWGAARRSSDVFQIPRFTPWDRSRWRFGARMARNLWNS